MGFESINEEINTLLSDSCISFILPSNIICISSFFLHFLQVVFTKLPTSIKPGVVTGQALVDLLDHAKEVGFAIPGVNIVGTNSINACMEAAAKYGGPIMVTFSKGGGQFIAGKKADNTDDKASIAGAIAGALHVRQVAALYGVPVILLKNCMAGGIPTNNKYL